MGIINRGVNMGNARVAMTMKEFQKWVQRDLDADRDGRISKDDLADFLRRNGEWFPNLKARRWMRSADSNRNGVVDESEIGNLAEFYKKYLLILDGSEPFAECRSPGSMDSRDGKHRLNKMSDRLKRRFPSRKQTIDAGKSFQNYDFTEDITEAGLLSAPAKSEAESMFLTEEQLKEVFKRFEAKEEPVLHRKDLEKAFNHFGLFFPHHAATVSDAKKEGRVKLTELDDLVNSAVRLGYTVN
ncbi:hypothetical protein OIU78_016129 [Salix suchowensis]|nr:hypothetical protein OIU78_016129 [Salix suchowensis]